MAAIYMTKAERDCLAIAWREYIKTGNRAKHRMDVIAIMGPEIGGLMLSGEPLQFAVDDVLTHAAIQHCFNAELLFGEENFQETMRLTMGVAN